MTLEEHMEAIRAEQREWESIRDEKVAAGLRPSAYQVTLEQRKRMLARGERSPSTVFLEERNPPAGPE